MKTIPLNLDTLQEIIATRSKQLQEACNQSEQAMRQYLPTISTLERLGKELQARSDGGNPVGLEEFVLDAMMGSNQALGSLTRTSELISAVLGRMDERFAEQDRFNGELVQQVALLTQRYQDLTGEPDAEDQTSEGQPETIGVMGQFNFPDLIEYGKSYYTTSQLEFRQQMPQGKPWSFSITNGEVEIPITHENDKLYLIGPTSVPMTPSDILTVYTDGSITVEPAQGG